ncbi:MAG TPA: penicillin-binding protein 2 [Symbiobacteriaceae bacterium]|nr:penicillin-binding protein 2 [Symbiobacteriaceae bacterium]
MLPRLALARRILGVVLLLTLLTLLLAGRLFAFQIGEREGLARAAYAQRTLALPLAAQRGLILDRNGVPLTDPAATWGLVLFPALVQDQVGTAKALVGLFGERLRPVVGPSSATAVSGAKADLQALLVARMKGAPSHQPLWLVESLSPQLLQQVQRLRLPGLQIAPSGQRYGPNSLARHLVGHLSDGTGAMGLERLYQPELAGGAVPTLSTALNARGGSMSGGTWTVRVPGGKEPDHVWTTISAEVQAAVEAALDKAGTDWSKANGGAPFRAAAVVLDPNTGELLAMASRPQIGQSGALCTQQGLQAGCQVNRALQAYPPGSIFKVPVAGLALDRALWQPDGQVDCSGTYRVGTGVIKDLTGPWGSVGLPEAFAHSCNTPWAKVGVEGLGKAGMQELFRRFELGAPTGATGLWGEASGTLPTMNWPGEVAQAAFGQGLTATPLQMARVFAAIANGGRLPSVRVVEAVRSPEGRVLAAPAVAPPLRVLSRETAKNLQSFLRAVTELGGEGTGQAAWVPGWGSAGKTGTAEAVGAGGRPVEHAWFAGWTPLERPKYVITVLVEEGGMGGMVAAPIFGAIGAGIRARVE